METRDENPIYGRKIFFVTPPLNIENYVIEGLREQEYEVYVIKDYKYAKSILKINRDALCFFYIDTALSYEEWYKFIKTFEQDEILKTVFVGLLSSEISEKKKNFFLLNTNLPGGFVDVNVPMDVLLMQLQQILDVNGAKGRRQYIRLDCKGIKNVSGYIAEGTKLFTVKVLNISTGGIVLQVPGEVAPAFAKNKIANNISLTLGRGTFVLQGVVYDSKVAGNICVAVLLIRNYKAQEKKVIRDFIFDILDEKLKIICQNIEEDTINYAELELPEGTVPFGLNSGSYATPGSFREQIEDELSGAELESLD